MGFGIETEESFDRFCCQIDSCSPSSISVAGRKVVSFDMSKMCVLSPAAIGFKRCNIGG